MLIGVDSDARVRKLKGEGRPVNKAEDRAAVLLALKGVDAVYIFDTESEDFLALARPNVWVKGGDYTIEKLRPQERAVMEQCGGEIVILPLHNGDSTSSIVQRIKLSGTSRVIPIEQEPEEPVLHGGPTCDCHKPHPSDDPPPVMREATAEDRERLGLTIAQIGCPPGMVPKVTVSTELSTTGTIVPEIISAPTLAEINPFKPDGAPLPDPKTPFEQLFNLVQTAPCPRYGPQMRYPGGLSDEWSPCGTCPICRLKVKVKELVKTLFANSETKNCPFCGGLVVEKHDVDGGSWIEHVEGHVQGSMQKCILTDVHLNTSSRTHADWNTRHG